MNLCGYNDKVCSLFVSLFIEPISDLFLQFIHVLGVYLSLAKRAAVLHLQPVFDAFRMEIVLNIARQRSHIAVIIEFTETDGMHHS